MIVTYPAIENLSAAEYQRYARQIILPEIGIEGQCKLKQKRVLVVGSGGLGSPVTLYLAAAGVGFIDLIDFDTIDVSNLHRQVLFSIDDVGKAKVEVATERLRQVNPHTVVTPIEQRLSAKNAESLIAVVDLVIDCTDNFETRYLINDACLLTGKQYVYASIFQFEGYLSIFAAENGPCYRCIYGERPPAELVPTCAEDGVLGVLPGVMGTLQGVETIKLLLNFGTPLVGRLLQYDALTATFHQFNLGKDPHCPACSAGRKPVLQDHHAASEISLESATHITPIELVSWQANQAAFVLLDVRSAEEHQVSNIEGAVLMPLGELERRKAEISPNLPIVCYCLSGARSTKAAQLLTTSGLSEVSSLTGGILAWQALIESKKNEQG